MCVRVVAAWSHNFLTLEGEGGGHCRPVQKPPMLCLVDAFTILAHMSQIRLD